MLRIYLVFTSKCMLSQEELWLEENDVFYKQDFWIYDNEVMQKSFMQPAISVEVFQNGGHSMLKVTYKGHHFIYLYISKAHFLFNFHLQNFVTTDVVSCGINIVATYGHRITMWELSHLKSLWNPPSPSTCCQLAFFSACIMAVPHHD